MARGIRMGGSSGKKNLIPLIPIMTSATSPSGIVTTNAELGGYQAYKVFDSNIETYWVPSTSASSGWVQYQFPSAVCVKKIYLFDAYGTGTQNVVRVFDLRGSNDGITWYSLQTITRTGASQNYFDINNSQRFSYYRVNIQSTFNGYVAIQEIQMYG